MISRLPIVSALAPTPVSAVAALPPTDFEAGVDVGAGLLQASPASYAGLGRPPVQK